MCGVGWLLWYVWCWLVVVACVVLVGRCGMYGVVSFVWLLCLLRSLWADEVRFFWYGQCGTWFYWFDGKSCKLSNITLVIFVLLMLLLLFCCCCICGVFVYVFTMWGCLLDAGRPVAELRTHRQGHSIGHRSTSLCCCLIASISLHPTPSNSSRFILLFQLHLSINQFIQLCFTPSCLYHSITPSPLQDPITTTRPYHHYKTPSPLQDPITTTRPYHHDTIPPTPHYHPCRSRLTYHVATNTMPCFHLPPPTASSSVCWRRGWPSTLTTSTGKALILFWLPSFTSTSTTKVLVVPPSTACFSCLPLLFSKLVLINISGIF